MHTHIPQSADIKEKYCSSVCAHSLQSVTVLAELEYTVCSDVCTVKPVAGSVSSNTAMLALNGQVPQEGHSQESMKESIVRTHNT